jgi:hypothetical protein
MRSRSSFLSLILSKSPLLQRVTEVMLVVPEPGLGVASRARPRLF